MKSDNGDGYEARGRGRMTLGCFPDPRAHHFSAKESGGFCEEPEGEIFEPWERLRAQHHVAL